MLVAVSGPLQDMQLRTSRGPTLLFGLLALGGIATGAWSLLSDRVDPTAVVVAVRGCSEACQSSLVSRMRIHLEDLGLEVRPGPDEDVPESLAEATDLAELASATSDLGAAHAVWILVTPVDQREASIGGATVSKGVRIFAQSMTRGEAARTPHELVFAIDADEEDRARLEAGIRGVDALSHDVGAEILQSDRIAAYLESSPSELDRLSAVSDALRGAEARQREMDRFEAACTSSGDDMRQDDEALGAVRCLTQGCDQEYLIGVMPNGEEAILRVETAAPVFPILRSSNVGTAEVADRLVRASGEGVRSTIVSVENLYSYATLAADGRSIAFVEVANGLVSLVWVELDGIRRAVLFEVDWPERMSSPELSPDGRHVAFSYRPFRRGEPQLFVVRTPPEPTSEAAEADSEEDADSAAGNNAEPEAPPTPLPFEPVPFGVSATWVEVAKEGAPDELETLLAVVVPGEREELQLDDGPAAETQAVDESDIEEELVGVNPERAGLNLPPLTHVALARITGDEFEIVGRIGGVERPVRSVVGSHTGKLVVMSYSRVHGCGIGIYDRNGADGTALTFVQPDHCPANPQLTSQGTVVGEVAVEREGVLPDHQGELVAVDPATGFVRVLTQNGIRDRYVRPAQTRGGTERLFFERLPRRRYARHPAAGVCFVDLPELDMTRPPEPAEPPPAEDTGTAPE